MRGGKVKAAAFMPAVLADPVAFVREQLGIVPDEKQAWMLASDHHRLLVNCSRQWGKTTTTAAKALHHMLMTPKTLVVVMAPVERQSRVFVRKVSDFVMRLGMNVRTDGDNRVSVMLPNRSRVVGLPGSSGDRIRGLENVKLLVFDEAARLKDDCYHSARPMLATSNGDIWALTTPMGKRGFFYKNWVRGEERWEKLAVKATECPRIPAEFLEEEREEMGDDWVRQEYLCEFVDMEGAVFVRELVDAAFDDTVPVLVVDGPWLRQEFRRS